MPRLSQADAELVVRCLERVLEETRAPSLKCSLASGPVWSRLAPLPIRGHAVRSALREQPATRAKHRVTVVAAAAGACVGLAARVMPVSKRPRRPRRTDWIRALDREHALSAKDLIWPVFVTEGSGVRAPVAALPGVSRLSIDQLIVDAKRARALGIPAVAVFPVIASALKDDLGTHATDSGGLACRAARALAEGVPGLGLIGDIALDPLTSHGHDGVFRDGEVLNDETVGILAEIAVVHARAGFDVVAPSDMMDGRVGAIRAALDTAGLERTLILSYAVKYASAFYGPFRSALGSERRSDSVDKRTYQMDPANAREALREVDLDLEEGADLVMVKPGLPYLDVIRQVKDTWQVPTVAYQVSGEYAMLRAGADAGAFAWSDALMESLLAFKRAGADAIVTYAVLEVAQRLRGDYATAARS